MIYLAVDSWCHGCKYFKVEDVVNTAGDHVVMCSLRQKCWEKRQIYLTSRGGDIYSLEVDLSGLGDR